MVQLGADRVQSNLGFQCREFGNSLGAHPKFDARRHGDIAPVGCERELDSRAQIEPSSVSRRADGNVPALEQLERNAKIVGTL